MSVPSRLYFTLVCAFCSLYYMYTGAWAKWRRNERKNQQLCSVKVKLNKLTQNVAGIAVQRFHTSKKKKHKWVGQLINRMHRNILIACAFLSIMRKITVYLPQCTARPGWSGAVARQSKKQLLYSFGFVRATMRCWSLKHAAFLFYLFLLAL